MFFMFFMIFMIFFPETTTDFHVFYVFFLGLFSRGCCIWFIHCAQTMMLPVPLQPGSPAKAQRHCPE